MEKVLYTNSGLPREANDNLYTQQLKQIISEFIDKAHFTDNRLSLQFEMGEIVLANEIILFINIWNYKELFRNMDKSFNIEDEPEALKEAWQEVFKQFIILFNGGLRKITS